MRSIVSIELLLDAETEEFVRAEWARLAAAGLPSMGAHPGTASRPHVTLLVRQALRAVAFTEAAALLPIPVVLGDPIVFRSGQRAVLARRVVPGDELLEVHRIVHETAPPGEDAPHTAPGHWTPHVTLARRLHRDSLADALRLLGPGRPASAVGLRRWDSASATITPLA